MHGGHNSHAIGTNNPSFKDGRHSRYLPAQMAELYEDALWNPDLLDMSDHIALLEARMQSVLNESADGDPAPNWREVKDAFDEMATVVLQGKPDDTIKALEKVNRMLQAGVAMDRTWDKVTDTVEQLRKVTDTEVKRRKELNLMVPIERVVILMAAVAKAVKRNVKNPVEVDGVLRELATLHSSDYTPGGNALKVGPEVIDIAPEMRGNKGGRSREAHRRRKKKDREQAALEAAK